MADAPRLTFWWERVEDTSILRMPRDNWNAIVGHLGEPLEIDVSATPISQVAQCSSVVASIAHRFGPATAQVAVFRYDSNDEPTPINQDKYDVWTNLAAHPRLPDMINAASTEDNANLRNFMDEHVFFVKLQHGPDHWLRDVPSSITALLKKY